MSLSNWLCSKSTANEFLKIVLPGGHIELIDRPVLTSEIMARHPRCCVTHPHVFQEPWAVIAPDKTLMPGKKYYVVPLSSVRKLQRIAMKNSPSPAQPIKEEDEGDKRWEPSCWTNTKKNTSSVCFSKIKIREKNGGHKSKDNITTRNNKTNNVSPRRQLAAFHYWQPSLQSISEE